MPVIEDLDTTTLAVAPGTDGSFWALAPNGHVRRFAPGGGAVVDDLGVASPFDSCLDAVAWFKATAAGVVVGSRHGLVAVTSAGSRVLFEEGTLRQADLGALRAFAVDASGERGVLAGPSLEEVDVVRDWDFDARPEGPDGFDDILRFEGSTLRRVARVRDGRAVVAVDDDARWIAVTERTSIYSDPGSLEVLDFATGESRWRLTGCHGPLLHFLPDGSLVAGQPSEPGVVGRIAIYDPGSGRRIRTVVGAEKVFAISADGTQVIIDGVDRDDISLAACHVDLLGGRITSLGTSWYGAYGWWCIAPGLLLDDERAAFPVWKRPPPSPSPVIALRDVPWV